MKKAKEIIEILNAVDENVKLEAKRGSSIDKSVMESICAFSNEPNLGGGLIVLGIQREENSLFPSYIISGINNTDQLQADIASQCASIFNFSIRPIIEVETVEDKNIIKIQVEELVPEKKPLFFKNLGIPKGIFRRIGSTDQHCSEEDLSVFYGSNAENYDTTIISGSSIEDISDEAVDLYRKHIKKVKPNAEELEFDNLELLYALNAISAPKNDAQLTLTGLLVFGKRMSLRRLLPMFRVDYIRVAGKEWVENPDERFESTIDMRGALLELLPRTIAAIADDLPKGFYLPEGSLQSNTETGLPYKVLREAIVNALIHRSYKVNSPIQIIRYSNRIEIINAGYSLKSLEAIGEPGSFSRNPHIAAIFHDTNLAETKGTGIKSMRKHLKKSQLLPPTFESSHTANSFTLRLLLHHLINEKDHLWLSYFEKYKLNDEQKTALIFLREVGAIDNQAYRQLTGVNLLQSNLDLRKLVSQNFLEQKGNSKKLTYYVPGKLFLESLNIYQSQDVSVKPETLSVESETLLVESETLLVESETLLVELPETLQQKIRDLGSRSKPEIMEKIILEICNVKAYNLDELSKIVNRRPHHIREKFLNLLMKQGKIEYTIPEVINHPKQAYKTITNEE